MAAIGSHNVPDAAGRGHQRTKSSVLKSFIHRRNNSDGTALPPSLTIPANPLVNDNSPAYRLDERPLGMAASHDSATDSRALEELQQNQQDHQLPRSPKKSGEHRHDGRTSPIKSTFANISLKGSPTKESAKISKTKEASPVKPKKSKSVTNFATLLSRPKSIKNLHKLATDDSIRTSKDKENRSPPSSLTSDVGAAAPPIYAQFCTDPTARQQSNPTLPYGGHNLVDPFAATSERPGKTSDSCVVEEVVLKPRPKSFQPPYVSKYEPAQPASGSDRSPKKSKKEGTSGQRSSTWGKKDKMSRPKILTAFPGLTQKSKAAIVEAAGPVIDAKDIDSHLEALLDRRNIPENQRYKMRNLTSTIKMEFIRQDWAETQAKKLGRPVSHDSDVSADGAAGFDQDKQSKSKHSRVKSLTLSKGGNKTPTSPTKKKAEGTLGRHLRTKSTESVVIERPSSSSGTSSNTGILSKLKNHQAPNEFVSYLRKVQKPELVEVGKLHKLRLLLRNETVTWTEDFIRQGGMKEIVGLLHRIMEVEWREEHEDALLHENLLCLKALCTTALALQYLHSIHATLFPALLHMIFDPEKKGPSEFTTRSIITSVLFTYIQSAATPQERVNRADIVLRYLRDPEAKEDERPVSFVLEMRRDRPYRVWCKEATSVTKEVFWIFLHNLNVVALPADKSTKGGQAIAAAATDGHHHNHHHDAAPGGQVSSSSTGMDPLHLAYMARHFPQERPPVPAAPYVGGVEWDATNYLASHLDLLNAILACTPGGAAARNRLRDQLRVSGWERCLGGSLRLCKEKFYGAVHDGLRTWVAAAHDDGWDVKDVRYGPPPEQRPSPRKTAAAAAAAAKKADAPAPKIEMPKLDFALGGGSGSGGGVGGAGPMAKGSSNKPTGGGGDLWL